MLARPSTSSGTLLPSLETIRVFGGTTDAVWDWLRALLVDASECNTLRKLRNLRQVIVYRPRPYKGREGGARKCSIRLLAGLGHATAVTWPVGYTKPRLKKDQV